jgi:hypothetical protein
VFENRVMSTLRSALDEFVSADVRALPDGEIAGDLDELEHAGRVIEAERARRLAEVERRGLYAMDGHLSVTSWLVSRHRVSHAVAAGHARVARALEQMPVAAEALTAGEVSTSAVTLLASAQEAAPEQFASSEETLVDAARTLPVEQLKATVMWWRETHRTEADDDHQEFYLTPTLGGRGRVAGDLNRQTTQVIITALRAVQDIEMRSGDRTDTRSPARRRADALGEICRQWLDSPDRPLVRGERPHVIVTVDIETLQGRDGKRCELSDLGPISAEEALRLACDAQITRVITDAASRPLDVGRTMRIPPPWLRRALIARDRGCAFPACGRAPSWCDPHHIKHWTKDGPSALHNLVLLCRRHHRLIHHRRFSVQLVEGLPVFHRTDGTVIEAGDRAPP